MKTEHATSAISEKKLSDRPWTSRFEGSTALSSLGPSFRSKVEAFVSALRKAGATVRVTAAARTAERAYLMHWSWRIVKQGYDPSKIPPMRGVDIEWAHNGPDGSYSAPASLAAAAAMVQGFAINGLGVAPAFESRRMYGGAIDMRIE